LAHANINLINGNVYQYFAIKKPGSRQVSDGLFSVS